MAEPALYDNDIVLKICAYDLVREAITAANSLTPAILPAAQFSLRDQANRTKRIKNREHLQSNLEIFLEQSSVIEPSDQEIEFAAKLEEAALDASVQLDTGESQLIALIVGRSLPMMLTGDKRAIVSLHTIQAHEAAGRIVCLEHLFLEMVGSVSVEDLRSAVCAEPDMDKTLTICFACLSDSVALSSVQECLSSYLEYLRSQSGPMLLDGAISTIVAQKDSVGLN